MVAAALQRLAARQPPSPPACAWRVPPWPRRRAPYPRLLYATNVSPPHSNSAGPPISWAAVPTPVQPEVAAQPADYPEPPNWSRLVFQSYRDRNWEIYTSDEEGGGLLRLTYRAAADARPKFNRLARRIVFESNDDDNWDIWVMNAEGTGMTKLTHNKAADAMAEWSPDGTQIVFTSDRTGNPELFVMQADGSNVRQLTFDPGADTDATLSSAGDIAWVRSYGPDSALMLMKADGSSQHMLAGPLSLVSDLVWDSDGKYLAYAVDNDADGFTEMEVLAPAQGWRTPLTAAPMAGRATSCPAAGLPSVNASSSRSSPISCIKVTTISRRPALTAISFPAPTQPVFCLCCGGGAVSSAR